MATINLHLNAESELKCLPSISENLWGQMLLLKHIFFKHNSLKYAGWVSETFDFLKET